MSESLDFYFYAPPSTHNWNPFFRKLGGTYSNDNNSLDFIEKIQHLCSNSSSKCVLPKTFRLRLQIPYCSKVIVETVTEGYFSTHYQSD